MSITITMHKNTRFIYGLCALQLIVALLVLPVSAATEGKPTISASMSTVFLKAGEPLTVQGIATGQATEGVQIWIFAGNYLNVRYCCGQSLRNILKRLYDDRARPGEILRNCTAPGSR